MKKLILLLMISCSHFIVAQNDKAAVNKLLDDWHLAAADGKFEAYFGAMAADAIFIGTDAEENWTIPQFKAFAKPYFDKGKAWDFKPVQRNIYFAGDIAYFDELLDTWMKICRGSGVLKKVDGKWKIAHYVLSMTIPNDDATSVVKIIDEKSNKAMSKIKTTQKN